MSTSRMLRVVLFLSLLVVALGSNTSAADYIVDRLTDTGEGDGLQGDLRYCINSATSGKDTITFAVTGTINLTRALPDLTRSVTIGGPGRDLLAVRRESGGNYRIFTLVGEPTVVISGLTIANGRAAPVNGPAQEGGIYVSGGLLILTDSFLSNNQAAGADGANGGLGQPGRNGEPGMGGGLYVAAGQVQIYQSTLSNNQTIGGKGGNGGSTGSGGNGGPGAGGGFYVDAGTVSIRDATLSNNQATGGGAGSAGYGFRTSGPSGSAGGDGFGGGLSIYGGAVAAYNSTLMSNQVKGGKGGSGGIDTGGSGGEGRSRPGGRGGQGGLGAGGGLSISDGAVQVYHSTFTINRSFGSAGGAGGSGTPPGLPGDPGQGAGGGLHNRGTLWTRNTILAGNTAANSGPDLSGEISSLGYNLIGDTGGGSGFDETTDLLNVDPRLGPLQDNGGPTPTHALLPGSPAIDAGDNTDAPEFDQRGEGFPRIVNGIIDIGAFEVQKAATGGSNK